MLPYAKTARIDGKTYRFIYVNIDPRLPEEIRDEISCKAIHFMSGKKKSDRIRGDGYEGRIVNNGFASVGAIAGTSLEAKLDTDHGCVVISILANSRYHDPRLN